MITINDFYKKIIDWLIPLGYVETYKSDDIDGVHSWHFIKDNIRVVCVYNPDGGHFYLHADILLMPVNLAIITGNYDIGSDQLELLHKFVGEKIIAIKQ